MIFHNILEIIPAKGKYGRFIYIDENDELYYHIYFNDDKEEIKNKYKIYTEDGMIKHEYYIDEEDKVTKIKIIIDYQVKSFNGLFSVCKCIESIRFKKFYRNNITDMSHMFQGCFSLKELNLNNFNTNNVTNMSYMFRGCLDELKLKIKGPCWLKVKGFTENNLNFLRTWSDYEISLDDFNNIEVLTKENNNGKKIPPIPPMKIISISTQSIRNKNGNELYCICCALKDGFIIRYYI